MYFLYGKTEVEYLKGKDKILGAVIDEIGHVDRETDTDLFSSVVHHIIGQQISTKAQATIWQRMKDSFGDVNAAAIAEASISELHFARQNTFRILQKRYRIKNLTCSVSPLCRTQTQLKN